jgi:hypothetical protein
MATSLSPISKAKLYEIKTNKISQTNGFEDSISKLSRKENTLLEEVNLQVWRKNLKLVRERSLS